MSDDAARTADGRLFHAHLCEHLRNKGDDKIYCKKSNCRNEGIAHFHNQYWLMDRFSVSLNHSWQYFRNFKLPINVGLT